MEEEEAGKRKREKNKAEKWVLNGRSSKNHVHVVVSNMGEEAASKDESFPGGLVFLKFIVVTAEASHAIGIYKLIKERTCTGSSISSSICCFDFVLDASDDSIGMKCNFIVLI